MGVLLYNSIVLQLLKEELESREELEVFSLGTISFRMIRYISITDRCIVIRTLKQIELLRMD